MTNKIAIVAGDGGIRGGFIAGALSELYRFYDLGDAELIAASSASVGGLLYHFSHGADHPAEHFWTKALIDPAFLDPIKLARFVKGQPVLNLDYLVDDAIRSEQPYALSEIFGTSQPYYFPVIDYDTRKTVFLTNIETQGMNDWRCEIRRMDENNIYEYIKASKAAPILFDQVVEVDGGRYLDGGVREPFTLDLPGMESAKIILVVSSKYWKFRRNISYYPLAAIWYLRALAGERGRLKPWVYRALLNKHRVHMRLHKKVRRLEAEGRLFLLAPEQSLKYSQTAAHVIEAGYRAGIKATQDHEEALKNFIFG